MSNQNDNPKPTMNDYNAASARGKGYLSYMYAAHDDSEIPEKCPFEEGTQERLEWIRGQNDAMMVAQDSEE